MPKEKYVKWAHSQLEVKTAEQHYQQIYKQNMKIRKEKLEACARTLETHQDSGNYLDNRGMTINLKNRRNSIYFAYQDCNLAGLQNQRMQFGNDSKLEHNVFSRELWHNYNKNIMVCSPN